MLPITTPYKNSYQYEIQINGSEIHSYNRQGELFILPIHHLQDTVFTSSTKQPRSILPLSNITFFGDAKSTKSPPSKSRLALSASSLIQESAP
jgi:hypothetical protein